MKHIIVGLVAVYWTWKHTNPIIKNTNSFLFMSLKHVILLMFLIGSYNDNVIYNKEEKVVKYAMKAGWLQKYGRKCF